MYFQGMPYKGSPAIPLLFTRSQYYSNHVFLCANKLQNLKDIFKNLHKLQIVIFIEQKKGGTSSNMYLYDAQ